ncbi:hypothetical protein Flexsi_0852 [Flexistipes sinusarabici DSM 4947]|uniref:Uncharacterized protein n=2 Tax=Flexistipes sinusarabici TaxID=2352 RepID=F8E4U6_FLESM|nr:hypothetical protein Flexsi_0852 [Flexistipes sinusarabici DSM 4947]
MEKYIEPTVLDSMLDFKTNDSTYLDKINSLIDWKKVKSILDKKYRWCQHRNRIPRNHRLKIPQCI